MVVRCLMLVLVCIGALLGCQKELSCEDCTAGNSIPVAKAGPDQKIELPKDSIILNGSASTDKDGRIVSWLWRQIAGPNTSSIVNPADSVSIVRGLAAGVFSFELTVTDNGGLTASDTMLVAVTDPRIPNRPPIANAGNDTTISLPANTVDLNGNGSTDPDFNIAGYEWTSLSGPGPAAIADKNNSKTTASDLIEGVYDFILVVVDSAGLTDSDTMRVTVKRNTDQQICGERNRPEVMARLIPVGNLSKARLFMSVTSVGNKILFAGGTDAQTNYRSEIDIFDVNTNTWSTARLCAARSGIAAVSSGNKVFFAGGETGDGTTPVDSVDIYNAATNSWSVSHLSTAGNSIAAAAVGSKLIFAGGDGGFTGPGRETRVDIFDLSTGNWSTANLSEGKRLGHSAVVIGNKVFIAGGETWQNSNWFASDQVDVYDDASGNWSRQSMIEGKLLFAGIGVDRRIFWAGGSTGGNINGRSSCSVIEYDTQSGLSLTHNLSGPTYWFNSLGQNAVVRNNKILFLNHNKENNRTFDIYDLDTRLWSIGKLDRNLSAFSVISFNNEIYIAGGNVNGVISDKVWKLDF